MVIVGLTGSIGTGKTTFADYLANSTAKSGHWESWQLVAEVANHLRQLSPKHPAPNDINAINSWLEPLPDILKKRCRVEADFRQIKLSERSLRDGPENYDKLFQYLAIMQESPALQKVKITEENKETMRPILQWLGGYLAKTVGGDIWYKEIIRRIQDTQGLDLATIGGVRFPADAREVKNAKGYIVRIVRPNVAVRDQNDLTEREQSLIRADVTVENDGTLEQLKACAEQVANDLRRQKLTRLYKASAKA